MRLPLGSARFRIELHPVGLDAHDRPGVSGEEEVRNLREHRIREVLDHQGHAVRFCPAEAEKGAGLGFTRFQSDTGPAEFATHPHELPVVGTFVHEERFPGAHAADVDAILLKIVGKRLLDIENFLVGDRIAELEAVEDFIHVGGILDGAVEVRR